MPPACSPPQAEQQQLTAVPAAPLVSPKVLGRVEKPETPLPMGKVACAFAVQFCEGFQINLLFPLAPFMVDSFHIAPPADSGFYVGLLAAAFCAAQFVSSGIWGAVSDRAGRKRSLMLGMVGSVAALLVFGFSVTYAQAMAGRIVAGILNGNIGIIKSFLSESTDGTNRARAFAYMSLAWGISCVVAPAAGGLLSRPAEQYPGLVSADSFFGRWPFALPCLVAVVVQLVSLIICAVWMQDSVRAQPKVSRKVTPQPAPTRNGHMLLVNEAVGGESDSEPETDGRAVQLTIELTPLPASATTSNAQGYANVPSSDALSPPSSASDAFPTPTRDRGEEGEKAQLVASDPPVAAAQAPATHTGWGLLRDSLVLWACSAYGLLALVYIVLDEGLPLFLKAPAERGGLSFSSAMIGIALSVSGLELIVFTLCFSPRIMRRLGNFVAFRWASLGSVLAALSIPAVFYLRANPVAMWVGVVVAMTLKVCIANIAFIGVMVMVNNSAPAGQLGAVNGIGQSFAALARAVGPAVGGALWALSTRVHVEGHHSVLFLLVAVLCLVTWAVTFRMPPSLGEPRDEGEEGAAVREM